MIHLGNIESGRFCWLDLAATNAERAKSFYGQLFGWTSHDQSANGGSFTRLRLSDQDVGSMYQMTNLRLDSGTPSHWTPYVRVNDAGDVARRVSSLGGEVIVKPFVVCGVARVALILDSVGALVGLWEPIAPNTGADGCGEQYQA